MKKCKLSSVALAVSTIIASFSISASSENIEELTKRVQELEAKIDLSYADDQQPMVLTPDLEIPLSFVFSGYARYGAHYSAGDQRYVQVGSTGTATGRLGNEANGGEFQFAKVFSNDDGPIWDVAFMIDQWGVDQWSSPGGLSLKKAYAGVTNIFESQPDLYVWAGRDFHQRPKQGLNDYTWMNHDGQGGGFYNLDVAGTKFDFGFVGQVDYGDSGALGNDTGRYALTSKLHGIEFAGVNIALYANYGFASDEAVTPSDSNVSNETAWQIASLVDFTPAAKVIVRYADGADSSVFNLSGDVQALYASFEGSVNVTQAFAVEYLTSYKNVSGSDADERNEYSVIVRPTYQWNNIHSTWLETGYALEDHKDGDEKNGWKVTLSQNISWGGLPGSRPMLRFYTTVGDVDNSIQGIPSVKQDTLSVGAMWEAWW